MNRTLIIAEAGVNHNGKIQLAKQLIEVAAKAGADYIKFQTFNAEQLVSRSAPKARYQTRTTDINETQFDMIKKLEIDTDTHLILMEYCKEHGIGFLSSPFDISSIELLSDLGMHIFKIPSGEITNLPYLLKIGSLKKEVILSTGMSNLSEIGDALKILTNAGTSLDKITILHCNSDYPTPYKDVNLKAMLTIRDTYGVNIGYSDHTLGIEVAIAAVSLGATCIEKHFTLDKGLPGPDHKASLEPPELFNMIKAIRNVELAMGDGVKRPSSSEKRNINIVRKSIHLNKDLPMGHFLTRNDLIMLRPGDGLSPMIVEDIIGKRVKEDLKAGAKLRLQDFE